jgi:hypothetical protein
VSILHRLWGPSRLLSNGYRGSKREADQSSANDEFENLVAPHNYS